MKQLTENSLKFPTADHETESDVKKSELVNTMTSAYFGDKGPESS